MDTEEINSDLDDSDTDGEEEDQEGTLGEVDTVLCTYDKVRVNLPLIPSRGRNQNSDVFAQFFAKYAGRESKEQMEVRFEGRNDTCKQQGLFVREVHLVCRSTPGRFGITDTLMFSSASLNGERVW